MREKDDDRTDEQLEPAGRIANRAQQTLEAASSTLSETAADLESRRREVQRLREIAKEVTQAAQELHRDVRETVIRAAGVVDTDAAGTR